MDWSQLRLRILIDHPIEDVFDAWTNVRSLARWFVSAEFESGALAAEGSPYRWTWASGERETGEVAELEYAARFGFTFGRGIDVLVTFAEFEGRTLVQLVQRHSHAKLTDQQEAYVAYQPGWTFYLTNLKSVLEGGPDLREFNATDVRDLVNL